MEEQIWSQEQSESAQYTSKTSRPELADDSSEFTAKAPAPEKKNVQEKDKEREREKEKEEESGPFRLSIVPRGRMRGAVSAYKKPTEEAAPEAKEPPATKPPPPVEEPKQATRKQLGGKLGKPL